MGDKYQELITFFNRMEDKGILPMAEKEYDHSLLVGSILEEEFSLQKGEQSLSFDDFQSQALDLLSIYPDSIFSKEVSSISIVPREDDSIHRFNTTILADCDSSSTYPVSKIDCPKKQTNLSPYYLAHEYHHALKDTSKKEYVYMLRYADVIPQFFELIAGKNKEDEKALIQNRFALLQELKKFLTSRNERDHTNLLFSTIDSKNCQYLNSFYYSILLYTLYQEHPKLILEQIKRVLSKEITTFDLLDEFRLFEKDFDSEVEREIQYLKKYSS